MDIEELKELWGESNRRLEASTRLNTQLLAHANLDKAGTSLNRLARGIWFEVLLNFVALIALGAFAADHLREPRFFAPALALGAYALALLAAGVRQIVAIERIDYDAPVVAIQAQLERLRLARVRASIWTLLFAPLMWVPLLIVAARGLFGVDVYSAAAPGWLIANALFGLAVIPLAIAIARRFGGTIEGSAVVQRLAGTISGRNLTAALEAVDALRRFEAEG